jgi:signal transduction histidine kinase
VSYSKENEELIAREPSDRPTEMCSATGEDDLRTQLTQAHCTIRELQEELAETNRGLMALTLELEKRVDDRTAELRAAQEELKDTNTDLMILTLELENRVAQRTAELSAKHAELNAMTGQLWQAAKLATMGELAASIAHELNNPLATINLRVEALLGQVPVDSPACRSLQVIEHEIDRMAGLVSSLLEFSRRNAPHISPVNVREEVERSLELIRYHLRKHSIDVMCEMPKEDVTVQADRHQLRQVFLNLFSNACDAMPQGGTVTVCVSRNLGNRSAVVIEISDTGGGIPAENLGKIYEPFYTTKPEGKGTGLGLAICKRVIQEHAGTMDIASTVGLGTTVRIAIPVTYDANEAQLH